MQIVNVSNASAHMYGTKVEIKLPKLEPGSWSNLNFPNKKLPVVKKSQVEEKKKQEESDEEFFDLDDIKAETSFRLSEMSMQSPNNLD